MHSSPAVSPLEAKLVYKVARIVAAKRSREVSLTLTPLTTRGPVGYKPRAMFRNAVGHHNYWHHHHRGGGLAIVFPALIVRT